MVKDFILRYIFSVFGILSSGLVFCQWSLLPSPTSSDINGLSFYTNNNTGYIAADDGVYITNDGGFIWNQIELANDPDSTSFANTQFQSVKMISLSEVYVAGNNQIQNNPIIFMTIDGGTTWDIIYEGESGESINELSFDPFSNGFAVGTNGLILKIFNQGSNVQSINTTGSTTELKSVSNIGSFDFIAVGDNVVIRGTNSGLNLVTVPGNLLGCEMRNYENSYATGEDLLYRTGNAWSSHQEIQNIDPNLTINCFAFRNASSQELACVGTDQGIYSSIDVGTTWEHNVSSGNYTINDIEFPSNANIGFAVGNNGVILKAGNGLGPTVPFVNFLFTQNVCEGEPVNFTNLSSTSYSFQWKLGTITLSTSYHFEYTFMPTGQYPVSLIGYNGDHYDTLTIQLDVLDPPSNNLNFNISDSLICNQGSTFVELPVSEDGVSYSMLNLNDQNFTTPVFSDGGSIQLPTGPLNDTTQFIIRASIQNTNCFEFFQDTLTINVERVIADFHTGLYNASLGEPIPLTETSYGANFYEWEFGANSTPQSAIGQGPFTPAYSSPGNKNIALHVASTTGCSDSIERNLFVYDYNNQDDGCWAFSVKGFGDEYEIFETGKVTDIDAQGNLLICGDYEQAIFVSKTGQTPGNIPLGGSYLGKYDDRGVLKWLVTFRGTERGNQIEDAVIAPSGSIYVTGSYDEDFELHYNDGSVEYKPDLFTWPGWNGFLLKLDENGKKEWIIYFYYTTGLHVDVDDNENVFLTGRFRSPALPWLSDIYGNQYSFNNGNNDVNTFFVARYNSSGEFAWVNVLDSTNPAAHHLNGMSVDPFGNIFLTGELRSIGYFHSSDGSLYVHPHAGADNLDGFIARYSPDGILSWTANIATPEPLELANTFDYATDIAVDAEGNCFVTGGVAANYLPLGHYVDIISPDSVISSIPTERYFIAGLDSNGVFLWGNGAQDIGSGTRGTAIEVDHNGNVYTSGYAKTNYEASEFFSVDGNSQSVYMEHFSIFITKYDNSGNLQWVTTNDGSYTDFLSSPDAVTSISVSEDDAVFLSSAFSASQYPIASDTITAVEGNDGFFAKFTDDCICSDIIYTEIDTTICYGEDYNGIMFSGDYEFHLTGDHLCDSIVLLDLFVLPFNPPEIIQQNETLSLTFSYLDYQWFLNGVEIPGAVEDVFVPAENGQYTVSVTGSNGCIGVSPPIDFTLVSTESIENRNTIQVHPNPTSGKISIKLFEEPTVPIEFVLFHSTGQKVFQTNLKTQKSYVDLSFLAQGFYLYQIKYEEQIIPGKLTLTY
ncbi:MAG: T9SS type A sorting domain-containing protein [Bacteroidota bacterium]